MHLLSFAIIGTATIVVTHAATGASANAIRKFVYAPYYYCAWVCC